MTQMEIVQLQMAIFVESVGDGLGRRRIGSTFIAVGIGRSFGARERERDGGGANAR